MELRSLGTAGPAIPPVAVGCMSFGEPIRGTHPWTLPEAESRDLIRHCLAAGLFFFDTANMYSDGSSEEILGRALRDFARRDEVVIATKLGIPMPSEPGSGGLSAQQITQQVDASLRRLGTDYIDLYQIHRWDPHTPIEETMEALHQLVQLGKVRFLGASSMWAWQFATAQVTARLHGWTPFISMQDHYNLLQREEEREMHPLCRDSGVGIIPWSPLARGLLTRPWETVSHRQRTDEAGRGLYSETDGLIVGDVQLVAERHGVPMAQVALAWVMGRPGISAPLVGMRTQQHLSDALSATQLQLEEEDVETLERHYTPRSPVGF